MEYCSFANGVKRPPGGSEHVSRAPFGGGTPRFRPPLLPEVSSERGKLALARAFELKQSFAEVPTAASARGGEKSFH